MKKITKKQLLLIYLVEEIKKNNTNNIKNSCEKIKSFLQQYATQTENMSCKHLFAWISIIKKEYAFLFETKEESKLLVQNSKTKTIASEYVTRKEDMQSTQDSITKEKNEQSKIEDNKDAGDIEEQVSKTIDKNENIKIEDVKEELNKIIDSTATNKFIAAHSKARRMLTTGRVTYITNNHSINMKQGIKVPLLCNYNYVNTVLRNNNEKIKKNALTEKPLLVYHLFQSLIIQQKEFIEVAYNETFNIKKWCELFDLDVFTIEKVLPNILNKFNFFSNEEEIKEHNKYSFVSDVATSRRFGLYKLVNEVLETEEGAKEKEHILEYIQKIAQSKDEPICSVIDNEMLKKINLNEEDIEIEQIIKKRLRLTMFLNTDFIEKNFKNLSKAEILEKFQNYNIVDVFFLAKIANTLIEFYETIIVADYDEDYGDIYFYIIKTYPKVFFECFKPLFDDNIEYDETNPYKFYKLATKLIFDETAKRYKKKKEFEAMIKITIVHYIILMSNMTKFIYDELNEAKSFFDSIGLDVTKMKFWEEKLPLLEKDLSPNKIEDILNSDEVVSFFQLSEKSQDFVVDVFEKLYNKLVTKADFFIAPIRELTHYAQDDTGEKSFNYMFHAIFEINKMELRIYFKLFENSRERQIQ